MPHPAIEKRIRWAGCLIVAGAAVQAASLFWHHPLAFMTFIVVGAPLAAAGVLLYLYALATKREEQDERRFRTTAGKG